MVEGLQGCVGVGYVVLGWEVVIFGSGDAFIL